jgi:hypothetical protein
MTTTTPFMEPAEIAVLTTASELVLGDLSTWAYQCHAASITLVKALSRPSRVARGTCPGVGGQHSWVVLGDDCYDESAIIIDPTLWSYRDDVDGIYIGPASVHGHRPHGHGTIWRYGRPADPTGPVIELARPVSRSARDFLSIAAPQGLDRQGWAVLANSPIGGWPAGEIIAAMDDTPELSELVPIDRLGMLTDRNPQGLYLKGEPGG